MNGYPTKSSCILGLTHMFMSLFGVVCYLYLRRVSSDGFIHPFFCGCLTEWETCTSQSPLQDSRIPRHKNCFIFLEVHLFPQKKDFAANLSKGLAWHILQSVVKQWHPQTHLAIAPHPQRFTTSPRNFYGFQLSVQSPSSYSIEDEVCHLLFFRRR